MIVNKRQGDTLATVATPRRYLIACGALARELLTIIDQLSLEIAELTCLPAAWHNHPEKIVPGINAKVKAARKAGFAPFVTYVDRNTGGMLDVFLSEENISRVPGPHCYQSSIGKAVFDVATGQELGTFFLTDCIIRHFERIVMRGMGPRDHPHLRDIYFAHYKRILHIAQTAYAALVEEARQTVATLQLDYNYYYIGNGDYPAFFHNFCPRRQSSAAAS